MKKPLNLQWQAFTSTLSTTLVLILMGLVILFVQMAHNVTTSVRENLVVTATLSDEASHDETARMLSVLRTERFIKQVDLIEADKVLEEQIEALGNDPTEFVGFNPYSTELEMSMMPQYANSDSLDAIAGELKARYPHITGVSYQRDLVDNLNSNLNKLTLVLAVLAIGLLVVLVTLINNTVRLSIYSRRFLIHTMKLVGASWGFIRQPFLKRSFIIGLVAAIVANICLLLGVHYLLGYDPALAQYITTTTTTVMAISVMVLGLLIMLSCTYVSVNHFIKLKEHEMYER